MVSWSGVERLTPFAENRYKMSNIVIVNPEFSYEVLKRHSSPAETINLNEEDLASKLSQSDECFTYKDFCA
jgi:hypothetical protein